MRNKGAVAVIVIAIIAVLSLGTWSKSGMKPPVEGQEQAQTQESVSAAEQSQETAQGQETAQSQEQPQAQSDPIDYADPQNWAYYEKGKDKPVDVFLICPTVDTRSETNSLEINDKLKGRFVSALDMEKGIYEETGRLFSPYYRQMSINAFKLSGEAFDRAEDFAYRDISDAFRWYLDHENNGRGLILAGFSQGSDMCMKLLEEYFGTGSAEAEALRDQLITVYAIGWRLTEEMTEQYPQIVPASGEDDIGTVVAFDCEDGTLTGTIIIPEGVTTMSINPLNWKTDDTPADKTLNKGAVMVTGAKPIPELCGAYIGKRGELVVTDIEKADYPPVIDILPEGAYHIYDYLFYFTNLKENIAVRTQAWMAGQDGAAEAAKLQGIRERGVLKVGSTGDYNPMSYLDPTTGEYVGFDAALTEDLAASLGVEIEYVPTSWPTLMEDTLAGKFDLAICGITVTDAREEQALMSEGYLENGKTILVRAEDAAKYTSLDDINRPEVRVMVNPGGLNEKFARENLPDATLIIHDVNQDIPGLIAEGEADVMITEIMEAGYYVGQDSRLAAPLIYEPFTNGQLGVLMPKGSEDLLDYVNAFLVNEKDAGRIDELADEYIYRYIEEEEELAPAA